ncbi:MAG: hypothetical protein E7602_05105 [Ruminococcaceae bacterium]|nr:hypothetical protein [Oscillospiraceae bacterium]
MEYKYGYFNESGDEFIITAPNTPRPFDNFLFNDACYANVHQTGIGCFDYQINGTEGIQLYTGVGRICDYDVFGKDHLYNRLVFIRDNETGEFWTLNWEPVCHPYQSYKCTQGLGYTIVENKTSDTMAKLRLFVPTGNDACEIWKLSVKNEGAKKRSYSIFTYSQIQFKFKWGFDSYGDTMFRGTRFDEGRNTFYMNKHPFIKPHNYLTAFMVADEKITGSEGCQNVFIGEYGTIASPEVVRTGESKNSIGSANATICSLRFDIELDVGENKDISLLLGAGECEDDSIRFADKYLANQDEYFEATKNYYKALYNKNHITTNDEHFDRLINFWGKHATHFGATWCRWGYNGYRDIVQHGFGVVSFKNERTKQILKEAIQNQYASGMAVRGWNPVDTKAYSDSALWLEFTLTAYLRETGDIDFLNEVYPFRDEGEATVLGHMDRALDFLESNKGEHNLLLIKFGDWNDSLTGVGKEGRGESVWLSIAYSQALLEMAELAKFLGMPEKEANYLARREAIKTAINDNAWDGEWYRRCYTDNGSPLGSKENKYAKMFMEPQCWSLISGVASEERANTIISAMNEHMATPVGYLLLTPSYKEFDPTIGRISSMEPGICENGTIYSHTNIWMILGLLKYGKADLAYELFKKIAPGYMFGDNTEIKNKCLPYMFSNCYFGPEHRNSAFQMEYSWITGSVAWYTNTMESYLVGAKATYEGLMIDPHLPFDKATITREFRGATYEISISNPDGKFKADALDITVDGKAIDGIILPDFKDGKTHKVSVVVK